MRMLMERGRCTVVGGVTSLAHPVINMYGVQEFGSIFRVTTTGLRYTYSAVLLRSKIGAPLFISASKAHGGRLPGTQTLFKYSCTDGDGQKI